MHCNKVLLIGRIRPRGGRITYDETALPTWSFTLEIDESSKESKVFASYIPVEIVGK